MFALRSSSSVRDDVFKSPSLIDTSNVTGHSISVLEVHRPTSLEDVVALVRSARISKTPLYPISTGFNWGYGSRSPVVERCALVDLSLMKRIRHPSNAGSKSPVIVVEPGVTQIQLYEYLETHHPDLTFNVTGAGRDTSIIGNALDRGVGYYGPRAADLFGLEIVLGTGEVLRTGFRRLGDDSPLATAHPWGLGPALDGLFFQGNFGIVTSACLKLMPKRPKRVAISLAERTPGDLPKLIDELARLKRDQLLSSVTHIGNRERTRSTLAYGMTRYLENECHLTRASAEKEVEHSLNLLVQAEWAGLASLCGNSDQVHASLREIKKRTEGFAHLRVFTERRLEAAFSCAHRMRALPLARRAAAALAAMRPLHQLALGKPTDVAIENLLWKFGHENTRASELDRSRCGLLFVNPAIPLDGRLASEIARGMAEVAARFDHRLHLTLNIETETSLVAVANLLFDRRVPEEVKRAHECADALYDYIRHESLEVYRARADMMERVISRDPQYWAHIRALKQALDPDEIIAPGRYNPI